MKSFKSYYLPAALTILMCLSGCAKDENILSPNGEEVEGNRTELLLSITMPASTKAKSTSTLSGTEAENKLNNITLFIVDGNAVQDYTVHNVTTPTTIAIAHENSGDGKRIYAAANMTDAQIAAVKTSENPAMTIENISDITGTNGFLMTAQATGGDGSTTIDIPLRETTNISAKLDRVMSKVLLTCDTKEGDDNYVKLTDNQNGYIRLSDVHYELANTNKKFYPFAKPGNEDPNYDINDALLNSLTENFFPGNGVTESSKTAVKYEAGKASTNDENRYTDGLYCLENTVNMTDFAGDPYQSSLNIAKKVGTYVKISAKFTPAFIDEATGLTEEAAQAKLINNGTFYTYKKASDDKKHVCYSSLTEARRLNAGSEDDDFTEYTGGLQHYETFVASPAEFTAASNLKRNNYYIMRITSMTAPIREKTIEVNTTVAEWTVKGKTVIDIETNN